MNLENLKLVELNTQEAQEVEGGNPIAVGVGIAAGVWGVYTAISETAYHVGYWIGKNT